MTSSDIQQLPVQLLVDRAVDDLRMCLKGALFKLLAVHAIESDGNELLLRRFAKARGNYARLPRADSTKEKDRTFRILLDYLEQNSIEYSQWALAEGNRPLFRESIVTACVALESALKEIATALRLGYSARGTDEPILVSVPGPELRNATKEVAVAWNSKRSDSDKIGRACSFAGHELYRNPALINLGSVVPDLTDGSVIVSTCIGAFELRNALVHNLGRPDRQIEIGDEIFHPGFPVNPGYKTLKKIQTAFMGLVAPFDSQDVTHLFV